MSTGIKLYVYAVPGKMEKQSHTFTDDVAVTFSWNKQEALERFREYYDDVPDNSVFEARFNKGKIAILTSY